MYDKNLNALAAAVEAHLDARFPVEAPYVRLRWADNGLPRAWIEPVADEQPQARAPGLWVALSLCCDVQRPGGVWSTETLAREVKLAAFFHCEHSARTVQAFAAGWLDALEAVFAQTSRDDAWSLLEGWDVLDAHDLVDAFSIQGRKGRSDIQAILRKSVCELLLSSPLRWRALIESPPQQALALGATDSDADPTDRAALTLWSRALSALPVCAPCWELHIEEGSLHRGSIQVNRSGQQAGLWATLRFFDFDVEGTERSIISIREQAVLLVALDDQQDPERVARYLRGWVAALWRLAEQSSLAHVMPFDLVARDAFALKQCHTEEDFTRALLGSQRRLGRYLIAPQGPRGRGRAAPRDRAQRARERPLWAALQEVQALPLLQSIQYKRLPQTWGEWLKAKTCDNPICARTGVCLDEGLRCWERAREQLHARVEPTNEAEALTILGCRCKAARDRHSRHSPRGCEMIQRRKTGEGCALALARAEAQLLETRDDERVWRCPETTCHETGACAWRANPNQIWLARGCPLCPEIFWGV